MEPPSLVNWNINGEMPLFEPMGLDDYLSWFVTGYRYYPYSCFYSFEFALGDEFPFT